MIRNIFALLIVTSAVGVGFGAEPAAAASPSDTQQLAQTIRVLMLENLPEPLLSKDRGWGHQKDVFTGIHWQREGKLRFKPEREHGLRNDGHWQRLSVQSIDAPKTLALGIHNLQHPQPGVATFEAMLGLDVRMTYTQQVWKSGTRLYGGETRARCRAAAKLQCEMISKFEQKPGMVLPDLVFRMRVTNAEMFYTGLVCEHTAGLDGQAAKKMGEAIHELIRALKPTLEKDLIEKANAAVVKAADTKEVRVELNKMISGK